jgi:uncharacterized protein with HEPN domain
MANRDKEYLQNIIGYCDDIANAIVTFGGSFEDFEENRHYRHSVSMCILQIGEYANRLSGNLRVKTEESIPWDSIRGMRNRVAHAYGEMTFIEIFKTAVNDAPALKRFCEEQIKQLESEQNREGETRIKHGREQ